MEKGAIRIYKKIVLWASLIIVLFLFFWKLFEISNDIIQLIMLPIRDLAYYLLIVYSVIMLVYILAKRRAEEYIFGFAVPLLLIVIPFLITLLFNKWTHIIAPPDDWTYIISIAVLFLYVLYDKWKKKI
tara:strand:+ start:3416 stop:3802 length:387 start_codon:yes stop_codon:yes gene_type:complete